MYEKGQLGCIIEPLDRDDVVTNTERFGTLEDIVELGERFKHWEGFIVVHQLTC
jgi:hypothetical protein